MKTGIWLSLTLVLLWPLNSYASEALDEELAELVEIFSSHTLVAQSKSVGTRVRFSGVTDDALFDLVEENIEDFYQQASGRDEIQYVSWMVQMLAFSGNKKYSGTLSDIALNAKSPKIRRHASRSLEVLPKYSKWNPVISKGLEEVPKYALPRARMLNMLAAEDPELVRAGASVAFHHFSADKEAMDFVEKRLLELYPLASAGGGNDEYGEASAWLCKVLARG